MPPLLVRERDPLEQAPRLRRVVVRDRSLEVLARLRGLAELAAEPAEQTDGVGVDWHALIMRCYEPRLEPSGAGQRQYSSRPLTPREEQPSRERSGRPLSFPSLHAFQ